jgi:hypothetical protein
MTIKGTTAISRTNATRGQLIRNVAGISYRVKRTMVVRAFVAPGAPPLMNPGPQQDSIVGGLGTIYGKSRPWRMAKRVSRAMERIPSLLMMFCRCVSTVRALMQSTPATSTLDRPSAMS